MGNSIFDLADTLGYESPFGNWIVNNGTSQPAGSMKSSVAGGSIVLLTKERKFAIKTDVLLEFKLSGGAGFFNDTEFKVTLSSTNTSLKISTKSWTGENDYKLLTKISLDKPGKATIKVAIDGIQKLSVEFEFIKSKDVFTTAEAQRLKDEFLYMSSFVNAHSPEEYSGNYCLNGADRALGKLLNNTSDFYVVEHGTHKVKNSISFVEGNTYSRATQLSSKGFIHSSYAINSDYWKIDYDKKDKLYAQPNYVSAQKYAGPIQYDMAWVNPIHGENFRKYLVAQIDKKEPGFHVYYLSIVDGFHTQVLVIDNSDRKYPKYEIWEDYGLSSSSGSLDNIVKGINRQNSVYFTSSLLYRYRENKKGTWDKQTVKIWKIKSK